MPAGLVRKCERLCVPAGGAAGPLRETISEVFLKQSTIDILVDI